MKKIPPKLKCIIVDDSALQRLLIKQLVDRHISLEFAADFSNALDAKNFLQTHPVDLLFLDVEMPLLSGFDLLNNLEHKPGVIFVTGQTNHAFEAFSHEAIDFLEKPVDPVRFDKAIEKATSLQRYSSFWNQLDENSEDYIFIKSNLKNHKVYLDDLRYIEALGDYVKVITEEKKYTVLSTMKAFEKELPENRFLRVHKSYIVNLDRVKNFSNKSIQLDNDEIPLSRHRKSLLQETLLKLSSNGVSTGQHSQ